VRSLVSVRGHDSATHWHHLGMNFARVMENRMTNVDLNSDLGEGFGRWTIGDDAALLRVVTSANVACGFHASDASIMRLVCAWAVAADVAIGAHVGYRDLPGFGRRFIDIEPAALAADVIYQIGALDGFAHVAGSRVRYVKPHGALYNAIMHHEEQAAAVVEAVTAYDRTLPVLGLPGSAWLRLAGGGRPGGRGGGLRRPGLHPRGHAGFARAARCRAARRAGDRPPLRRHGHRRHGHGRRGWGPASLTRLDLRAW